MSLGVSGVYRRRTAEQALGRAAGGGHESLVSENGLKVNVTLIQRILPRMTAVKSCGRAGNFGALI
jgi:hypothetical protein